MEDANETESRGPHGAEVLCFGCPPVAARSAQTAREPSGCLPESGQAARASLVAASCAAAVLCGKPAATCVETARKPKTNWTPTRPSARRSTRDQGFFYGSK